MRNRAIIAPFWAPVDDYVAFKVNHSRVYYQVYSHTKPKGNRTNHILNMASQHVQIYDRSGKFDNFSATWVLVVTWKDLCPFFYYGSRTYSYDNEEVFSLPRLQCRWVSFLRFATVALFLSACARKFTYINEIEAMYETKCVNVKVERGLTFTLTRDTSPLT